MLVAALVVVTAFPVAPIHVGAVIFGGPIVWPLLRKLKVLVSRARVEA